MTNSNRNWSAHGLALVFLSALTAFAGPADQAHHGALPQDYFEPPEPSLLRSFMMQAKQMDRQPVQNLNALSDVKCVGGDAGGYPCSNLDLLSFLPLADVGGGEANDIWGWTDPQSGREYALLGRTTGTSFVDVTDPLNPIYLGDLPTHTESSLWRDIKTYADHAYIVSEARDHGMQVFDLTQLRNVPNPPVTFTETAWYDRIGSTHNIVVNTTSGYAFLVGTRTCRGGPHIVNIQNPAAPTFAGCYATDGYTHDAQCVAYRGPDPGYQERDICFNFNEDTVTISDTTQPNAVLQLARRGYAGAAYTHQGWLSEDHTTLFVDDELDERNGLGVTRTYIWDVSRLSDPRLVDQYDHASPAIDHNMYVHGGLTYQANYRAGLRVLDTSCLSQRPITEIAYFDIYPDDDEPSFNAAWSNYPFFESGTIIVSGIEQGLYALRLNLTGLTEPTDIDTAFPSLDNSLMAVRKGDDVRLTVADGPVAPGGYNFYRSDDPTQPGFRLGGSPSSLTSLYDDLGAVGDDQHYLYEARGIDGCGVEGP